MKTFQLSGTPRSVFGKTEAKKYRKEGLVSAVIYGKGDTVHFTLSSKEMARSIYSPDTYLFDITVDGKNYKAVLKSSQFHPVFSNYLLDVEFIQVTEEEPILVFLPVKLTGTAEGALAGGRLVQKQRKLLVKGLFSQLPQNLEVDVTKLKLGRSLKVGELSFQDFQISMPKDLPIASIEITRQLRQEASKGGK
jgi:large subunit ribosomal protein L25